MVAGYHFLGKHLTNYSQHGLNEPAMPTCSLC